jgi:Arc/MetJ family transcription regulator
MPRRASLEAPEGGGTVFTSLDIDEDLFMKAWGLSGLKTKKAFVEEMLRVYTRLHEQAGVQSLRGKLVWDGDLSKVRETRGAGSR